MIGRGVGGVLITDTLLGRGETVTDDVEVQPSSRTQAQLVRSNSLRARSQR